MKKPLLMSRAVSVLPLSRVELEIGRPSSIEAINVAINSFNSEIVVTKQIDPNDEDPKYNQLHYNGTMCKVKIEKTEPDGSIKISLIGLYRVRILNKTKVVSQNKNNYFETEFERVKERNKEFDKNEELMFNLLENLSIIVANKNDLEPLEKHLKALLNQATKSKISSQFADVIAGIVQDNISDKEDFKQDFIDQNDVNFRLKTLTSLCQVSPKKQAEIDNKITEKVNENLNKQQKEFYLRERIRVIKEELGEGVARNEDLAKFRRRLKNEPFPKHIKDRVLAEINKLDYTSGLSNESLITRNYIDWVMDLPWYQTSKDETDISKVEKTLEKNHYGLKKIKERILEFLAVQKRTKEPSGSIICLVGPPGVGKTSLAISIAEALNKKYVKVSLGGVSDESEIRGHRKTYLGSLPGRIIKGLKTAQVKNPLFLLDEIDKLKSDHRGDPASALLEVLDPKQNSHFSDNYIEEEFDLSKVMFIATANYEENIPHALYDRLEIINLTSYTEKEKLEIAKSHLIAEINKENGIYNDDLVFTDDALKYIIRHYTRESGVRELKRYLSSIARKFVRYQESNPNFKEVINKDAVIKYLKKELFFHNNPDDTGLPGVVNGMAYTAVGGDLLPIEVNFFKGKGNLNLTGNLKETMRESATVALSYIKANVDYFGLQDVDFQEIDINLHVPSGGIPKDGPSAGVTITTAILSALLKKPVSNNIAMTGEITLRGKVLVIGGVKEKVISATRSGVNKIFLPYENQRHLEDVPKEILDTVEIILVKEYKTIFDNIFSSKTDDKLEIKINKISKTKKTKTLNA